MFTFTDVASIDGTRWVVRFDDPDNPGQWAWGVVEADGTLDVWGDSNRYEHIVPATDLVEDVLIHERIQAERDLAREIARLRHPSNGKAN